MSTAGTAMPHSWQPAGCKIRAGSPEHLRGPRRKNFFRLHPYSLLLEHPLTVLELHLLEWAGKRKLSSASNFSLKCISIRWGRWRRFKGTFLSNVKMHQWHEWEQESGVNSKLIYCRRQPKKESDWMCTQVLIYKWFMEGFFSKLLMS